LNKSGMYLARKSDSDNYDDKEKDKVNWMIRKHFGVAGIFDEPIGTKEDHKFPDIYIRHRSIVIELDGEYHGNGDLISTSSKDYERHDWYRKHGLVLIVINKEATNGYDEKLVVARLKAMGMRRR